jgi:cupin 2 domain-containing protein
MPSPSNLLTDLPVDLPDELSQTLLTTGSFRIERIVSLGHASPEGFWYDQDTHEWALLVSGAARLQFEGEAPIEMTPGSYVNILPTGGIVSIGRTDAGHDLAGDPLPGIGSYLMTIRDP